jgi:hypothetical protein
MGMFVQKDDDDIRHYPYELSQPFVIVRLCVSSLTCFFVFRLFRKARLISYMAYKGDQSALNTLVLPVYFNILWVSERNGAAWRGGRGTRGGQWSIVLQVYLVMECLCVTFDLGALLMVYLYPPKGHWQVHFPPFSALLLLLFGPNSRATYRSCR